MNKLHTHYCNLKVSQDASNAIIRASYLALTKKYHPDINPSKDALRIMKIINNSYEVLSNPQKRKSHNDWISERTIINHNEFQSNHIQPDVKREPRATQDEIEDISFSESCRRGIYLIKLIVQGSIRHPFKFLCVFGLPIWGVCRAVWIG